MVTVMNRVPEKAIMYKITLKFQRVHIIHQREFD